MMDKVIVLVVSILMPGDVPDIRHVEKMDSFATCWDGAKDFLSHELTEEMREKGALGLSAACAYHDGPTQKD